MELDAQTTTTQVDYVEMECLCISGCERIVIKVTTEITDYTALECGEFGVHAEFDIIEGSDCIINPENDIYKVRWFYDDLLKEYNEGKTASVHFSKIGIHTISLEFEVKTVCGTFGFHHFGFPDNSIKYNGIITSSDCFGCSCAVSWCDFFCAYEEDDGQLPEVNEILVINDPNNSFDLLQINSDNNFGIFRFPYKLRDEHDCPDLKPGFEELIFDLNRFFDLGRTSTEYEYLVGHVSLYHGYGDPYPNGGGVDLCKIRIKFVDMGSIFVGFHKVDHYGFELSKCKIEDQICYTTDVHPDKRFGYDINTCCTNCSGIISGEGFENKNIKNESNIDKENGFRVYPTLTTNYIDLEWNFNATDTYSISIYNITGKINKKYSILQEVNYKKLNFSGFDNGIYFIELRNENTGFSEIKKVIKY